MLHLILMLRFMVHRESVFECKMKAKDKSSDRTIKREGLVLLVI